MRRLYLKLYLAFTGILFCCAVVVGMAWHFFGEPNDAHRAFASGMATLVLDGLPAPDAPTFKAAFKARTERLPIELVLYERDGQLLASSYPQPLPLPAHPHRGYFKSRDAAGIGVQLDDGRWFVVLLPTSRLHHRFLATLIFFGVAIAVGCYPLARQVTRRLESLKDTVDAFGRGALDARARVRGCDEVASLAQSFNAAASRIEGLIGQQKRMLASASHELRSPLARVRMAVELMQSSTPERREQLADDVQRDIEELDQLVEDLLLAVRADQAPTSFEEVDLSQLIETETKRYQAHLDLEPATIMGNRRMLKRLLSNLLDNADHYAPGNLTVRLAPTATGARITVEDRGPGVAEADRERIFEPFYRPRDHDEAKHGGVGLGLSLVRQIAVHHGGQVVYEPRPGGGSRFVVNLRVEAKG